MIGAPDLPRVGIFVAAALLLLVTPGPAVLYIVTRSVDQGRRVGLICLGVRRILDHPATLVTGPRAERAWRRAFLDRVVVNVLNPKTALFFLAFLPQFVDVSRSGVGMQVLALGALFVTLGLITDAGGESAAQACRRDRMAGGDASATARSIASAVPSVTAAIANSAA